MLSAVFIFNERRVCIIWSNFRPICIITYSFSVKIRPLILIFYILIFILRSRSLKVHNLWREKKHSRREESTKLILWIFKTHSYILLLLEQKKVFVFNEFISIFWKHFYNKKKKLYLFFLSNKHIRISKKMHFCNEMTVNCFINIILAKQLSHFFSYLKLYLIPRYIIFYFE